MSQTRKASALEAAANIVVGYSLAVAVQVLIFPLLGEQVETRSLLSVGVVLTVVALLRSYGLRRLFNWLHIKGVFSDARRR